MNAYAVAVSDFKLESKLQPGDPRWSKFNASFRNLSLPQNDLMQFIYFGQSLTTQHKDKWRATKNYLCGQHIGLDFDGGDESATLAHLAKDKFISRWAAFAHTTISHTDEHPRARVIFLTDAPIMQAANYGRAASALLWLFGTADRQCKDPVRFFYGAPGCEFAEFGNVLPLEVLRKVIDQYHRTGQAEKRQADRKDYLPPASQAEVAEALRSIPPWQVDYDEWVAVLMAVHAEFGEAGLPLAESWADGKEGEVLQKWRSFKPTGNEAGRIGIGSLFAIANRFGWTRG